MLAIAGLIALSMILGPSNHQSTDSSLESPTKRLESALQCRSFCPADEIMSSSQVTKLGRYPQTKRFLSIGIASVERPSGANYLLQTIQSLIDNLGDMDKEDTYIVIFLADLHEPPKSTAKEELSKSFGKYIDEGLLTVIEAYPEYYPSLKNIKKKFGDSDSRRTWRSKENVDTTFIMCYCKDLSQYYIHLEDDMISSPSFFPKLKDFIHRQSETYWPLLDVSQFGSKAKVFHSGDLRNIASYFYLMYDEMPIDWLMLRWRGVKSEQTDSIFYRLPPASLFQHIGKRSSLQENEIVREGSDKEQFFDQYDQKYKGLNPPASITSSMASYQGKPQDAYEKGSGYFWAKDPKKDDYVLITFNKPTAIQEIIVDTGSFDAASDLIKSGSLQVSFESSEADLQLNSKNSCGNFDTYGSFSGGKAKLSLDKSKKVVCLRILVTQEQNEWIYLREVNVW